MSLIESLFYLIFDRLNSSNLQFNDKPIASYHSASFFNATYDGMLAKALPTPTFRFIALPYHYADAFVILEGGKLNIQIHIKLREEI